MRKADMKRTEEKRREILAAAARCFKQDGLSGTSISKICAEARMSPGHLYHYFSGKEAIVEAMAQLYLKSVQQEIDTSTEGADIEQAFIGELHRADHPQAYGDCSILFDLIAEAQRNPKIGEILTGSTRLVRRILEGLIINGQHRGTIDSRLKPPETAMMLIALLDASQIASIRDPGMSANAIRKSVIVMMRRFLDLDA